MEALVRRRGRASDGLRPLALAVAAAMLAACVAPGPTGPGQTGVASGQPAPTATPEPTPAPTPTPPLGGTELYGYVPYWLMNDAMAAYVRTVPLTSLELSSVSVATDGRLRTGELAYRRIVGARGRAIIDAAHAAGDRVELTLAAFGYGPNQKFLLDPAARATAIAGLVALVARLGVDGLNVDAELVRDDSYDGYTEFVSDLAAALRAMSPPRSISVATGAGHLGAILALAATVAGVDRIFLMGYDYHWSGSRPGASSPLGRYDGGRDLRSSIAEYVDLGVPRRSILLGLPLYGMSWPVVGPGYALPSTGSGTTWLPSKNAALLATATPSMDPVELAEYLVAPDGDGWRAIYYDSPRTLRAKLALARVQGLAGAGFWAIGYERGVPGYLDLMRAFRDGAVGPADAVEPAPIAEPTAGPLPWPTAARSAVPGESHASGDPGPSAAPLP